MPAHVVQRRSACDRSGRDATAVQARASGVVAREVVFEKGVDGMMRRRFCTTILLIVLAFSAFDARAAVHVALVPSAPSVAQGSEFTVKIRVTQAGSEFNGYETIVHFDPAVLTFLPASPLDLQEGAYMKNACGTTFHWFTTGTTEIGVVHSLMCAGLLLTGPGDVYTLRFRADEAAASTPITFTANRWYRAGVLVETVSTNASVAIVQPSDASGPRPAAARLSVAPNPFNPSTVIEVETAQAGLQRLGVYGLAGRRIRVLPGGSFEAGARQVVWDGRADDGVRVGSGVYVVRLEAAGGVTRHRRVVLLK
jgi:hypothetical protein